MLINHLLKQTAGKKKYQGEGLLNFQQAADLCKLTVESFRHHVRKEHILPICREKQYETSRVPVYLFAVEQVKAFSNSTHIRRNR